MAVLIFATCVVSGSLEAATVTLQWDPNPEPDVAGYVVSYGTASGQYSATVDVGNQLQLQFAEPNPAAVYYFAVRAYNTSGLRSSLSTEVNTSALISALTLTSLSASFPSPQMTGTTITFTAGASGGIAPYQYKWRIFDGTVWTAATNWSTVSSYTWTPASANPNYRVGVWVRGATSTADAPDSTASQGDVPYPILQPLTLTNLYSNIFSPQIVGTSVTFSATAVGGKAPYQFKWLLSSGAGWTPVQDWSANSSFTWTPSAAGSSYSVGVWARSAGSTVDAPENTGAGSTLSYVITAPIPGSGSMSVNLSANKAAPEMAGSKIQWTAAASGSGPGLLQYKWWVFDGANWVVFQEWSTSNKFIWTPPIANPNYKVMVRAQVANNTSLSAGVSVPFPINGSRNSARMSR